MKIQEIQARVQDPSSTITQLPMIPQTPVAASISASFAPDSSLWAVVDPEASRENPVENKHRRLVRSHRSSPYDRELKPNAKIRDELGVSILVCLKDDANHLPL